MKGLIFTYALTYGGAAVSLVNPFYGLLIYVCFAILKPEQTWHWSVPAGNYSRIVAIAMLLGWALHGFGSKRLGGSRTTALCAGFYLLWCLVSSAQCAKPAIGWAYCEAAAKILLPVLVGITCVRTSAELRALTWVVTLSQGFLAYNENEMYLAHQFRAGETNNVLAHSMVVGAGVAFFTGVTETAWWRKLPAFACAGLMVHTTMLHMSRGAMLGCCVLAFFSFIAIPKNTKTLSLVLLGVIVALRFAGPHVVEEFFSSFAGAESRDSSAESRFQLWSAMLVECRDNPVFGLGPDHWPVVASKHGFPPGKEGHGLWFQFAAELGIPGLLAIVLFYVVTWRRCVPVALNRDKSIDPWIRCGAQTAVAVIPAFMFEQLFGSFEGMEIPYYVAMMGAIAVRLSTVAPVRASAAVHGMANVTGNELTRRGSAIPAVG